ncbi:MAG TPA: hypothetical protein VMS54_01655 [Vicinamibacterales bacterium]|nr:hypothetical protein [Vicinamibacterales bacterium]
MSLFRKGLAVLAIVIGTAAPVRAQEPPHVHPAPAAPGGWRVMQDGVVYALFNNQGGPRGDREFVLPNWWMGMATTDRGRHRFGLSGMLSLDALTVGKSGYSELFQAGEVLDGEPLVDRQHPHDFLMQLAASWRVSMGGRRALTVAGGPSGEPALGPVAFMHRQSAAGLPFAPLGHHTFDATHVSFGVVTASLDLGLVTVEGSVFNGREPDEDRWDLDLGRMDSLAGRVWFRPSGHWEFQASTGRLRDAESADAGDVQRTTVSAGWIRNGQDGFDALTTGWGMNAAHGEQRHGIFGEFTVERARHFLAARVDVQQLELEKWLPPTAVDEHQPSGTVVAFTVGGGRRVLARRGFEGALAFQVTVNKSPEALRSTHGSAPAAGQIYFRLRLPGMRMWQMRMSGGMGH